MPSSYTQILVSMGPGAMTDPKTVYTPSASLDGLIQWVRMAYFITTLKADNQPRHLRLWLKKNGQSFYLNKLELEPNADNRVVTDLTPLMGPLAAFPMQNQVTFEVSLDEALATGEVIEFTGAAIEGSDV